MPYSAFSLSFRKTKEKYLKFYFFYHSLWFLFRWFQSRIPHVYHSLFWAYPALWSHFSVANALCFSSVRQCFLHSSFLHSFYLFSDSCYGTKEAQLSVLCLLASIFTITVYVWIVNKFSKNALSFWYSYFFCILTDYFPSYKCLYFGRIISLLGQTFTCPSAICNLQVK